jgi:hypothetical protein
MAPAARATSELPAVRPAAWDGPAASEAVKPTTFQGLTASLPERYLLSDKQMPMRLGTWTIPAPVAGDAAGELVLYYFGAGQGGGVEENVKRWLGQFKAEADGASPLVRYESGPRGNLTITRATMEGTWSAPAMGPGAPAQPAQLGYSLDALIVEGGPDGTLFFRFTGPITLVRAEDAAIRALGASLAPAAP